MWVHPFRTYASQWWHRDLMVRVRHKLAQLEESPLDRLELQAFLFQACLWLHIRLGVHMHTLASFLHHPEPRIYQWELSRWVERDAPQIDLFDSSARHMLEAIADWECQLV